MTFNPGAFLAPLVDWLNANFHGLFALIARAIETGAFRQADVGTVAASLWAQVHGMAQLLVSGHYPADADPIAAGEAIIEGWRRGILPPDVEPLG